MNTLQLPTKMDSPEFPQQCYESHADKVAAPIESLSPIDCIDSH